VLGRPDGGLIAGEGVVVTGPGPIGLMGVGVAKSLGATPVILTGTCERRLQIGRRLGADHIVNVTEEDPVEAIARITAGRGVQYVLECSGAPAALDKSARMVNRRGRICLAAFPHEKVLVHLIPTASGSRRPRRPQPLAELRLPTALASCSSARCPNASVPRI
jgi:threonine dehydrogenase-like Zn-dependent dehydrogenase